MDACSSGAMDWCKDVSYSGARFESQTAVDSHVARFGHFVSFE